MFVAGILVPDWYMQFVGGKKLWKPVSFLNAWTLLPFSWIGILEKDLHLQGGSLLRLGWVCRVFAHKACGKGLDPCWDAGGVGAGSQSRGHQGPSPEHPEGASASPQDHREAPAVQTSSASSLLRIWSRPLFVIPHEKVGIPGLHQVLSTGNVCCVPPASGCSKSHRWRGEVDGNYL